MTGVSSTSVEVKDSDYVLVPNFVSTSSLNFNASGKTQFSNISPANFNLHIGFPQKKPGVYLVTGIMQWNSPRKVDSYKCVPRNLKDLYPLGVHEIRRVNSTTALVDFQSYVTTFSMLLLFRNIFSDVVFNYVYEMQVDENEQYWNNVPQWTTFEDRLLTLSLSIEFCGESGFEGLDHDASSLSSFGELEFSSDL